MTFPLDPPSARPVGWVLLAFALACSARTLSPQSDPCLRCHGDRSGTAPEGLARYAPPRATNGATDPSDPAVGAHRAHLVGGRIRGPIECRECHVVPRRVEGHVGDGPGGATVTFAGGLGRAQLPAGVQPTYDRAAAGGPTCSNVYCHGATLEGGAQTAPVWVDSADRTCTSCHGNPPARHFGLFPSYDVTRCSQCHDGTVAADDSTILLGGGQHVDGIRQARALPGTCRACHAEFPPADAIHAAHSSPSSIAALAYGELHTGAGATAESYDFGCGECHPTDEAAHFDDAGAPGPDVDLVPPATPVPGDEVKRRNAADAAYDPATGTCTGVYCHSSGQETPVYATTPDWRNPPAGGLRCDGCHGNPPRYASSAQTPNSHVFFDADQWESGHFAGMPGPAHNSKHGGGNAVFVKSGGTSTWGSGQVASPMTCQTCHFDTVDGTNVLAGRFFYFDTTADDELPGGDPARFDPTPLPGTLRSSWDEWRANQCGQCHDGSLAPAGAGKTLPGKHVNGVRDVVFDARLAYGGTAAGLPSLPSGAALRPYYMTDSFMELQASEIHADAEILASSPQVLSMHLASARWDAATRTCSDVACHMLRQQKVDAGMEPLRWGGQVASPCTGCHAK